MFCIALNIIKYLETGPDCADTLEVRVRGLAEIQTLLAETYVGLPDHFATTDLYLETLRRQVTTNLYTPFDADSNDVLDSHEFHLLYQGLLSDAKVLTVSICEDDFLSFCDDNNNGNITEGELQLCTGVMPCELTRYFKHINKAFSLTSWC